MCTLLSPILWYFFSMMVLTGSSSLNVMKQKPLLLFVLFSMGSSMDSTCSGDHMTILSVKRQSGDSVLLAELQKWPKLHVQKYVLRFTSPKAPKYSLTFSSGVSGERPPTKIFFTGSLPFIALAFLGSMTLPLSLCSFCVATLGMRKQQFKHYKFTSLFSGFIK